MYGIDMCAAVLQGYMYLTNSHLCFFAHMPIREDKVLKSGSLNKKTQRTKRWVKHWFVLKNDVLSGYQSSSVSVPNIVILYIERDSVIGSILPSRRHRFKICDVL